MCVCINTSYLALNLIFEHHGPSSENMQSIEASKIGKKEKGQAYEGTAITLYFVDILVILHMFGG